MEPFAHWVPKSAPQRISPGLRDLWSLEAETGDGRPGSGQLPQCRGHLRDREAVPALPVPGLAGGATQAELWQVSGLEQVFHSRLSEVRGRRGSGELRVGIGCAAQKQGSKGQAASWPRRPQQGNFTGFQSHGGGRGGGKEREERGEGGGGICSSGRSSSKTPALSYVHPFLGNELMVMDTDGPEAPRSLSPLPGCLSPSSTPPQPQDKGNHQGPRARPALCPWGSQLPSQSLGFPICEVRGLDRRRRFTLSEPYCVPGPGLRPPQSPVQPGCLVLRCEC